MVAQAIVHEFCQSGALERSIETVRTNLKARVDTLVTALERDLPDARFVAPEGGDLMWVEWPRAQSRQALRRRGRARSHLRQGLGLPARGWRQHAAPGVFGRYSRADRRGHWPPGRGLQELERHPRGGVTEGIEEVGDDVVGLLFDLAFAVGGRCSRGGAATGRGRRLVGLAGALVWRPSSSTATRRSRHRQSTVHGPTDWLRSGSSMGRRSAVTEAALQAALHLRRGPVRAPSVRRAGRRCPGARDAGALDVLGAQVVLELGFGERSE